VFHPHEGEGRANFEEIGGGGGIMRAGEQEKERGWNLLREKEKKN